MAKKRRRYYDTYEAVKSHQHVTRQETRVVHDWEIDDLMLNSRYTTMNKRRRGRVGHVEMRRPK
jgi:hypothetical protein